MKQDIRDRADIDLLMRAFYSKVMADDVIGYIFTEVAKLDLDRHIPVIGDFWETLLFRTGDYGRHGRNPLMVHDELNDKTPLLPEHFERWLEIFEESVDELFDGEAAGFIKMRAKQIANRMMEYVGRVSIAPVNSQHNGEAAQDHR